MSSSDAGILCHVFFSRNYPDKWRGRLDNAWAYWREGGSFQVLRVDKNGRTYAYGTGDEDKPESYTVPFTTKVEAIIEACYSDGTRPPLPENLVNPDMEEFEVPLSLDAESASNGPVHASPDGTTTVRRLPLAEIRLKLRTPVITSETTLRDPRMTAAESQTRLHLAVTEEVTLKASNETGVEGYDATGEIHWSIVEGHGTLSATTGESITYKTHEVEEFATIEAKNDVGRSLIRFKVSCNYLITPARMSAVFTAAPVARINDMVSEFNEFYPAVGLDDCRRRAHFFAQVLTEVGASGNPINENMNYTPARLIQLFGYFQRNPTEAQTYGRVAASPGPPPVPGHPANQPAIGNRAYANRNGNGNVASGDGWNYRGRGYIQVTGRGNYTQVQNEINTSMSTSGVNIVRNPNSTTTVRGGMVSAFGYWAFRNINTSADGGSARADSDAVSRRINPGASPWADRWNNFQTTSAIFQVANCPRA